MVFDLIIRIFKPHIPIPVEYCENFRHLFGDIAWYGVLNGSTIAFLAVYATRLGATGDQIGLLGATAAIANLIFTLPVGILLSKRSIPTSVLWSAILNRIFYFLFIIIPITLLPQSQIWIMITATLIMSIPLTGVLVGFNALFAEAVPQEWRGYIAGIRNALISITSLLTTLLCGLILDSFSLATGYQIVFGIGFIGSILSTAHLSKIKSLEQKEHLINKQPSKGLSFIYLLRFDILRTNFKKIVIFFFSFHLFQYLVIPIFPIYVVNHLGYSDQNISWGMSLFQVMMFLVSTQIFRFSNRIGNQLVVGLGMILMAEFPALLTIANELWIYLLVVTFSGLGWGMVSATMYNYLLERMPDSERPAHMSWYNMALNAAILIGSIAGPIIAQEIGYNSALWLFATGRVMIGIALLLWG